MKKLAEIHAQDEKLLGCACDQIIDQLPHRLSHGVLRWAETTPDQLALVGEREQLSYAELAENVAGFKQTLLDLGVRTGDRVMMVCENGLSLMCLFLAISELDAVAAVINARLTDREIDLIQQDCDPRLTIYTSLDSSDALRHGQRLSAMSCRFPLGELLVSEARDTAVEAVYESPVDQVLAMIYTTGTTGTPKGVMLTHRNLSFIAFVSGRLRGVEPSDKVYCVLPMSHVFGLSAVSSSVLSSGGCVYLMPRFEAPKVLAAIQSEGVAGFLGVPTMYALMLENFPKNWSKNQLKFMYSGGSPLDPDLKARVEANFGLPLHNGYGLTETGPTICQTRQYAPLNNTSVGYCLPSVEIEIRDKDEKVVPDGSVGELWVKGPNVMKGYFRKPEATAKVLKAGWFNTEDLVYQDKLETINIAGRSKELIIRSGFNIYPPEVEAVINAHPQVSLSAVLGHSVGGDEDVYAFIQPVAGQTLDTAGLRAFAKQNLAGYKVPKEIVVMETLPAASSGKILKHKLREYFEA